MACWENGLKGSFGLLRGMARRIRRMFTQFVSSSVESSCFRRSRTWRMTDSSMSMLEERLLPR